MWRFITITLILNLVIHGCSCSSSIRKDGEVQRARREFGDCKSDIFWTYADEQRETYNAINGYGCDVNTYDDFVVKLCRYSNKKDLETASGKILYSENAIYSGKEGKDNHENESRHYTRLVTRIDYDSSSNRSPLCVSIDEDVDITFERSKNSSFHYKVTGLPGEPLCPLKAYLKNFRDAHRFSKYKDPKPKTRLYLYGPIYYMKCINSEAGVFGNSGNCKWPNYLVSIFYTILESRDGPDGLVGHPYLEADDVDNLIFSMFTNSLPTQFVSIKTSGFDSASINHKVIPLTEIACFSNVMSCYKVLEYLPELYVNSLALVHRLTSSITGNNSTQTLAPTEKIITNDDHEFYILVTNTPIDITKYDEHIIAEQEWEEAEAAEEHE